MTSVGLLTGAALAAATSALYFAVGQRVAARRVSADAEPAARAFVWWWRAIAIAVLLQAAQLVAAAQGPSDAVVAAARASQTLYLLAISIALSALLSYVWFVYTGRQRVVPIVIAYAAIYLAALWTILARRIDGFTTTTFTATPHYATDLPAQPLVDIAFASAFLLPQVAAMIAYLSLRKRTHDTPTRRRIATVGTALLVWLAASLLAQVAGAGFAPTWLLASQAIGVVAASVVLGAYRGA